MNELDEDIEEKRQQLKDDVPIPRQNNLCELFMNLFSRQFDFPPSLMTDFSTVDLLASFSKKETKGGKTTKGKSARESSGRSAKYSFQYQNCL